MFDFAICFDITQHMNELNIGQQGGNHLLNEMFDRMTAFERKLSLWALQLRPNSMTLPSSENGEEIRERNSAYLTRIQLPFSKYAYI
jgi:hypothetical protein